MPSSSGQVCDICGDVGNPKLIATCSNCHKFSEHIYCMHPMLHEIPISWYCEKCRWRMVHHDKFHSGDSRKNGGEEVQSSPKRQRTGATENGFLTVPDASCARVIARILSKRFVPEKVEKVKFLPSEGSCSRPSRANQRSSSLQGGSCSETNSIGISQRPISKKASVPVAASKFSHENGHAYMSHAYPKSVTHGKVQTISLQKQAVISTQPWQDLRSPEYFPSKFSTSGNFESVAVLGARDERHISDDTHCTPVNNIRHIAHDVQEKCEFKNTSSGLDERAGMVDSVLSEDYVRKEAPVDAFVRHDNEISKSNVLLEVEEEDLPNPPAVNDLPNPPAVHASWKGSFEILNSPSEFYEGFQAYTPGKLSRKAYLVVKEMPEVLQFTLQPRLDTWPEIFHANSPSGFDIALYFWADDICRKKYNHLLELMEKQDLSMHSLVNGVELLIFTSRQLPVESQRLSMQFYLWGVFLSSKGKGQHSSDDLKGKQQAVDFPSINSKFCDDMETNEVWREEVIIEKSLPTNYTDAGREWTDIPNHREASMDKSELPNCGVASRVRKDMPEPRDASRDRKDTPKSRVASKDGSDMLKSRGACKDKSDLPNRQGASRDRKIQSQETTFKGAFKDSADVPNSRRAFKDRAVTPNSRRGYMDRSDSSNCRRGHANKDRSDTPNSRRASKDTSDTPNSRPTSRERSNMPNSMGACSDRNNMPNSRGACRDRSHTPITRRRDRHACRERRDMSNFSRRDRSHKSRSASRDRSNMPHSRRRDRSHKSRSACRDRSNAPTSRRRDRSHKSRSASTDRSNTPPSRRRDRSHKSKGACRDRSNASNSRHRDGLHKFRGAFRYRTDMPSSRRRDRWCKSRGALTDRNDTPNFRHRDWSNIPSHGFDKIHSQQPSEERSSAWHLHRDDFDAPGFPTPSEERSAAWHLHQDDFDAPGFPIPSEERSSAWHLHRDDFDAPRFPTPSEERSAAWHLHQDDFVAPGFPIPIHGPGFTVPIEERAVARHLHQESPGFTGPIQERAVGRYLHRGDFDVPPGFPRPIHAPGFPAPVDPLSHEVDDLPPGFS